VEQAESLKGLNERAVGDRFIKWFNSQHGLNYAFARRAGEAPDLIYALPDKTELFVEVTSAYYGEEYARFIWGGVRSSEDMCLVTANTGDRDKRLVSEVVTAIEKKCIKRYETHCILVVDITSFWTAPEVLSDLLRQYSIPANVFAGIYIHGRFSDFHVPESYRMIQVKPYEPITT
jgi:hypothetical protein